MARGTFSWMVSSGARCASKSTTARFFCSGSCAFGRASIAAAAWEQLQAARGYAHRGWQVCHIIFLCSGVVWLTGPPALRCSREGWMHEANVAVGATSSRDMGRLRMKCF
uniref:Uncharacterized protein n=1 Tax=Arundo donax TaxID=35708 RepID=A0A0A8YY39_ARUDO